MAESGPDPTGAGSDPIPINPGGLVDPDHLVGRQEDLASVIDTLERSHGVALTGERRHGKTAFSRGVEQGAHARGWTVITQSLEGTRSADEVMAVLARVLVAALPSMARATAWLKSRAELKAGPVSIPRTTLTLDDLLNEACGHASRVLLILDELPICAREIERSAPGAGLPCCTRCGAPATRMTRSSRCSASGRSAFTTSSRTSMDPSATSTSIR
jgi:hypothetical protein